ncbi:hypothetical protein KW783_03320 [Candidatus Parcubacteria bacterium]|nr:hypothetical protein [Candidatus Parcubacteria bacterium]
MSKKKGTSWKARQAHLMQSAPSVTMYAKDVRNLGNTIRPYMGAIDCSAARVLK